MTDSILEPGATLGVLGGGQLGAMFSSAARRMGYRVAVWDPDQDAPAHRSADQSFIAPFSDPKTREQFTATIHATTFEWENVPAELCDWIGRSHRVRPSGAVLRIIQDRIEQKEFLRSKGFSVASFASGETPDQLIDAANTIGLPAVCKTATFGYDGKGQWILRQPSDVEAVANILGGGSESGPPVRWILEEFVDFDRELSTLVVRGADGECRTFPAVENSHEQGILRMTRVPAPISSNISEAASELAARTVAALQGVGVFCVEMFHSSKGLFINEIAPRPHNSGHYTLDACTVSQFEQQVRVLCGLPLGEVRLVSPATMVNLIGEEVRVVTSGQGYRNLAAMPGAVLHLYGKRVIRTGRKMGHVTFLAESSNETVERAYWLIDRLAKG